MAVLGIDPGLARTGYGVVEEAGGRLRALAYGCISTDASQQTCVRLEAIFREMSTVIAQHAPHSVAMEQLFAHVNAGSAMAAGEARGVAMLAARLAGLEVDEFAPNQIKQAVTGYGRADKQSVQKMICMLLGLDGPVRPADASDALAIAICGLHRKGRMA